MLLSALNVVPGDGRAPLTNFTSEIQAISYLCPGLLFPHPSLELQIILKEIQGPPSAVILRAQPANVCVGMSLHDLHVPSTRIVNRLMLVGAGKTN